VGPTLIGLIAADLPVIFWCRHFASLSPYATEDEKAGLEAVMNLATKVIVDTIGMDAQTAATILSRWKAQDRIVADLEWARLTPWREPLAAIFDNPENRFSKFHTIEIFHTDKTPSPAALYAAGWLSAPYKAKVRFAKTEGYGPGLHRIVLRSDAKTIEFERTCADYMRMHSTSGRERQFNYVEPTSYQLMNEELAVLGPDASFNTAFARAQELLGAR
jgi:glucose-6-phosphate dehydrogenase assembly protein OpcA